MDGSKYRASFGRLIRFQDNDIRLNIAVTEYKFLPKEEFEKADDAEPPREFTRIELFWTQKLAASEAPNRPDRGVKHHIRISDLDVRSFEPFACVKRLSKSVSVQDLTGVPVMSAIICDRLRIVAKYRSYVFRLSRSAQNSQNQRRRIKQAAAVLEVSDRAWVCCVANEAPLAGSTALQIAAFKKPRAGALAGAASCLAFYRQLCDKVVH